MVAQSGERDSLFERHRRYLFSIAYRLLGSVTDAEDAVQEAFLRWHEVQPGEVHSPRAYLATVVVRLCMDELRSARAKREVYVGPWLPEPLITTGRVDLTESVVMRESLSFAFLLMLEKLSPLERAVVVLRDVFDYDYVEIATTIDKSAANCRQIFHRAHRRLAESQSRYHSTREQQDLVTREFLHATASGDVQGLLRLLAEDAVSIADGGGKASAGPRPVYSAERIVRGFLGNIQKMPPDEAWVEEVNGQPAIVATRHGKPYGVLLLDVLDGRVRTLYSVVNPDKLERLFSGRE
jgi:RNA polymerase sigma-70 factor (ECF subfamily)